MTPPCETPMASVAMLPRRFQSALSSMGDHAKYKHPDKPGHVVVPHPRKDMAIGTLRNIYRQAGWEWR